LVLNLGQNHGTVTLFLVGSPNVGESTKIVPGGVDAKGATTYLIEDFQTITTTLNEHVKVTTPILSQLGMLLPKCFMTHSLTCHFYEQKPMNKMLLMRVSI
jgi:hypothetical protein